MRRNGDCSSSSSSRSAAPTTVYVFLLYLYLCSHLLALIFFALSLGFLYIYLESKLNLDTQFTYVLLTTDKHLFFFPVVVQILRSSTTHLRSKYRSDEYIYML